MNVLHLFSDFKWTGPAAPTVLLCQQLARRGHRVIFAYRKHPDGTPSRMEERVAASGIAATTRFRLNRHFSLTDPFRDIRDLRRFLLEEKIEIVHTHLSADHTLGALSARRASRRIAVVRTDHKRDSIAPHLVNRFLLRRLTDGVLTYSDRARQHLLNAFGLPAERVARIFPATDCETIQPSRGNRAARAQWGFTEQDVVVGVVARFQKYRKMNLFFESLKEASRREPRLKALLVGRSSQMEQTVRRPIRELGLEHRVVVAGYLTDQYLDALASMDVFVFLIAGSDGAARALREAMAMERAVLVNRVGMLPELIEPEVSGLVFEDCAEDLTAKLLLLAGNEPLRRQFGVAAREKALKDFSPERQAEAVERFYQTIHAALQAE